MISKVTPKVVGSLATDSASYTALASAGDLAYRKTTSDTSSVDPGAHA